MYSDTGNTTSLVLGFPIRTSSDQRSVGSSPRHIAASHVLHRPLMPRHPPCALKHLQHKNQLLKIEITPQQPTTTSVPNQPPQKRDDHPEPPLPRVDARNHYPRIKHHTPPPKPRGNNTPPTPHRGQGRTGLLSQSPTVCLAAPHHASRNRTRKVLEFVHAPEHPPTTDARSSNESPGSPNPHTMWAGRESRGAP